MASTQDFIPIEEIKDNLVFLKDGSVTIVLTTTAVNFALLFETEQIAIIESFAGLLNSLSFPIQILIISKRLDVSSYLTTLDKALEKQRNPKLATLTSHYRKFVENLIKEKDVLDKQFYLCLNVTGFELGLTKMSLSDRSLKANTILTPRRDHIIRQLGRIGLKAKQLSSVELIRLYYDLYNPINGTTGLTSTTGDNEKLVKGLGNEYRSERLEVGKNSNYPLPLTKPTSIPHNPLPIQPSAPQLPPTPSHPIYPQPRFYQGQPPTPILSGTTITPPTLNYRLTPPFIVEELNDDLRP